MTAYTKYLRQPYFKTLVYIIKRRRPIFLTVTRCEMKYANCNSQHCPGTMAKSGVQRMFDRIIRPISCVEHTPVKLNDQTNYGGDKRSDDYGFL